MTKPPQYVQNGERHTERTDGSELTRGAGPRTQRGQIFSLCVKQFTEGRRVNGDYRETRAAYRLNVGENSYSPQCRFVSWLCLVITLDCGIFTAFEVGRITRGQPCLSIGVRIDKRTI